MSNFNNMNYGGNNGGQFGNNGGQFSNGNTNWGGEEYNTNSLNEILGNNPNI
jgi:hypothetical protein